MTDTVTQTARNFVLTPAIMEKLSASVTFPDDAAINAFMVDAINSYLQLGRLYESGGRFLFEADGRDDPIVLHFPFAPPPVPAEAGEAAATKKAPRKKA